MATPSIEHGIRRGREQFRAGFHKDAIAEWKHALTLAYSAQRHADAFVLSKNLGDATLECVPAAGSRQTAASELQRAIDYYEYALGLLDTCELRDIPTTSALHDCRCYIRRRRRRAQRKLRELHEPPASADESDSPTMVPGRIQPEPLVKDVQSDEPKGDARCCSTCEQYGTEDCLIIVDAADGCDYCQSCYDAYYASLGSADGKISQVSADDQVSAQIHDANDPQGGSLLEEASVVEVTSLMEEEQPTTKAVEVAVALPSESMREPTIEPADSYDPPTTVKAITAASEADELDSATAADEGKRVYTLPFLLTLNAGSVPCPPELLSAPVRRRASLTTGVGPLPPTKKHAKAAKVTRPKAMKISTGSEIGKAAIDPTDSSGPPVVSILPSLELCHDIRDKCQLSAPDKTLEALATEFFDSPTTPASQSFITQLEMLAACAP